MTKIKLCGLCRPEDAEAARRLEVDYAGLMFYPKSKRFVDTERAWQLRQLLGTEVTAVGVFVNEAPETVAAHLNSGLLDMAQLHGQEDDAYLAGLRRLTEKPIIQAFRVASAADVQRAQASAANLILLDHGAGGTGQSFDWTLISDMHRPFFLAGGLNPDNAAAAIAAVQPYGVDVSSGIETEGVKDIEKMERFVKAVRGR